MSRIDTLTPQEIINIVGCNLVRHEIKTIFNYDEQIIDEYNKGAQKLRDLLANANNIQPGVEIGIIGKLIKRYPDKVNKRALALLTIYNFCKQLEEDESIDDKERRKIRDNINKRSKFNR